MARTLGAVDATAEGDTRRRACIQVVSHHAVVERGRTRVPHTAALNECAVVRHGDVLGAQDRATTDADTAADRCRSVSDGHSSETDLGRGFGAHVEHAIAVAARLVAV